MKFLNYLSSAALVLFSLSSCTSSPDSDQAQTSEAREVSEATGDKTLNIDTQYSTVEWIGTKVSGYHVGSVKVKDGEIRLKDGQITGGHFVMDMQSLAVTGPEGSKEESNQKLLGHLKSEDFFLVERYPDATFEITEVRTYDGAAIKEDDDPRQVEISKYRVTNPTHIVGGNLTIRETTKHIEFPAHITINENTAEAKAKFNINRKEWDIAYPGAPDDLIRDDVHLGIALRARE
jgi:polyisoprenoid-binding protein YceI